MKCLKVIVIVVGMPLLTFAQGSFEFYAAHGAKTSEPNSIYYEVVKRSDGVHIDSILTYYSKTKKLRSKEARNRKGESGLLLRIL